MINGAEHVSSRTLHWDETDFLPTGHFRGAETSLQPFSQLVGDRSHFLQAMKAFGRLLKVALKQNLASEGDTQIGENNGIIVGRAEMGILSPGAPAHFCSMSFLDLWKYSGTFNRCFDPKDILYARRGLAIDGEKLIPIVDYSTNWSIEDAYGHFVMRCITTASEDHLRAITQGDWDPGVAFNSDLSS